MATAARAMNFLLAGPERRLLRAIAARVPGWLRPNHFTGLGTLGALGAGLAYALTYYHPGWLWLATFMLVVNWLGDSLDGTLARVRHAERPRYGYYLDHIVDAFSTIAIGIGLGMSPYVGFGVAIGLVLVYLMLSINVYLESTVFGVFELGYGRLGPTEVRLALVIMNTLLLVATGTPSLRQVGIEHFTNRVLLILLIGMIAMLVWRFARNLTNLAKLEPQDLHRRSWPGESPDRIPIAFEIVYGPVDGKPAVAPTGERRRRRASDASFVAAHGSRVESQGLTDDKAG